jgi:hypothetical protein
VSEFFRTGMGATFYSGTMPKIADALIKIAENFEVQNKLMAQLIELHKAKLSG